MGVGIGSPSPCAPMTAVRPRTWPRGQGYRKEHVGKGMGACIQYMSSPKLGGGRNGHCPFAVSELTQDAKDGCLFGRTQPTIATINSLSSPWLPNIPFTFL